MGAAGGISHERALDLDKLPRSMADATQLEILKRGVDAWNSWRDEHRNEFIVDVDFADLTGANLRRAEPRSVDLRSVDVFSADLLRADLRSADLAQANLSGANVSRTKLSGTHCDETIWSNVDLSTAIGLDSIDHRGPSTIDFRTLQRSGPLPLVFLRGCGLPDDLITYLPSLLKQAIQFHSCFISYSSKDQEFADRLHADLQNKGVRCWFAPHEMQGGKKIHEQIDEAIKVHDKVLLILSSASMNSEWVRTEIAKARKRELREKRRGAVSRPRHRVRAATRLGMLRRGYRQRFRSRDPRVLHPRLQQVEES